MTWNEMIALLESGAQFEGADAESNYIAYYEHGKYKIANAATWKVIFQTYIPTEMVRHMIEIEPLDEWTVQRD